MSRAPWGSLTEAEHASVKSEAFLKVGDSWMSRGHGALFQPEIFSRRAYEASMP